MALIMHDAGEVGKKQNFIFMVHLSQMSLGIFVLYIKGYRATFIIG